MPRIEIELTSARSDGTWTWRAAGARQPKGMLDGSVLPGGAKVGDVLRAEADVDIDGITVRSAQPVTQKKAEPERIEIIGTGPRQPPVTTNMRGGGGEAGGAATGADGATGTAAVDRAAGRPGRPGGPGGPGGRGRAPVRPSRPGGAATSPGDRGRRARREPRHGRTPSGPGATDRPAG